MQPILVQKERRIMFVSLRKWIPIGITFFFLSFEVTLPVRAEFSLVHKAGMYDALQENGMQAVHTETQILYAKPGEWVYLYRPERASMISYVRWYNYDTDRAIPKNYSVEDSPTGAIATRIESTWAKDTAANNPKFKAYNDYGWFAYDYASDRVTTSDVSYIEIKYRSLYGKMVLRGMLPARLPSRLSPSVLFMRFTLPPKWQSEWSHTRIWMAPMTAFWKNMI